MNEQFDRRRLLDNIQTLIQERGLKIGQVETKAGVSAGYFSRLAKEDSKALPAIDVLWKVSKLLDVNIELLINGSFDHSTENVEYLMRFIQSLYGRTIDGSLEWSSYTVSQISDALHGRGNNYIPIIETDEQADYKDNWADRNQLGYDRGTDTGCGIRRIRSFTRNRALVWADDSCFRTVLDKNHTLHLFRFGEVSYDNIELNDRPEISIWYELIIEDDCPDPDYCSAVCNTLWRCSVLQADVEKLYQHLKAHEFDPRISQYVRRIINQFMAREEELPF